MSKVSQQQAVSLMGEMRKPGDLKDHRRCLDIIARLTRERDEAAIQRDNLRTALIAAIGLQRVCDIERCGFKAEKLRKQRAREEAA